MEKIQFTLTEKQATALWQAARICIKDGLTSGPADDGLLMECMSAIAEQLDAAGNVEPPSDEGVKLV